MKINALKRTTIAPALEAWRPVVFDVGARGGLDEDFAAAAWATTMVGFEPEPEEAQRLLNSPDQRWRKLIIAPIALGASTGPALLHIPQSNVGASLLPHNEGMIDRFGYPNLHRTTRTLSVETHTLHDAICTLGLPQPDYLKLDIEGAELGVLMASGSALQNCAALKIECSFLEQRVGQALAHDVIGFLAQRNFNLVEMRDVHTWRRRPIQSHPLRVRHPVPYSRGQIAQADLIFLRTVESLTKQEDASRAAMTAALLGHIDYGVTIARTWPTATIGAQSLEGVLHTISRVAGAHASKVAVAERARMLLQSIRSALNLLPPNQSPLPY